MSDETVILITEDDNGHADLLIKNLVRASLGSRFIRFSDGQRLPDFLFSRRECGRFVDVVEQLKRFLSVSQVPRINFSARNRAGAFTHE